MARLFAVHAKRKYLPSANSFFILLRMLWKFATDHPTEIEPVYYMSGTLVDSRDQVMKLVKGSNYEATKKLFSNLSSVHVHSLFKKITNRSSELVRNAAVVAVVGCFIVSCCCPRKKWSCPSW